MNPLRHLSILSFQLLAISVMLAVLWVKGYLWSVFFIALGIFLLTIVASVPASPPREPASAAPKREVPPGGVWIPSTKAHDEKEQDDDSLREPRPPRSAPRPKKT